MYPKPSFGGTFGWSKETCNAFSEARIFSLHPLRLGLYLGLRKKSEPGGSSCMWGFKKAPLGSSLVLKAFLWGHFWIGEKDSQRISWGLISHSSSKPARDMLRNGPKNRTRRVQLHVGLRKDSPGEFSCTQSLPLVTLLGLSLIHI